MLIVNLTKDDIVLALVSHVFKAESKTLDGAMSNLTLEDDTTIAGTNTISTLLATTDNRIGGTNFEKAEVQQWLSESAKDQDEAALTTLNTYLAQQTFLVANDWTIADLVYYARLIPLIKSWSLTEQCKYCHISRWFDHIQNLDIVRSANIEQSIEIGKQFDKSVTVAITKGAPKESIQKDATKNQPAETVPTAQGAKQKKEKKAKEPKAPPAEPELSPSMISFKVGLIQKAIHHPDADSLYVSTIDLGESEPRTVVSGLVKYIPIEEMQNRKVVCVCNLKPAAMRGIKSSAMVLAASPRVAEKDMVELVEPPASCQPGDVLTFKGFAGTPEAQLNPKKKIFEQIQVGFTTRDDLKVIYKDIKEGSEKEGGLVNAKGEGCSVKSLVGASIK